ncbi:MAG TPA: cytochrome c [Planctomycetaceae bacterium]|nr:cytochrome c [Planctomycetaceae bacterium]
MHRSSTIRFRWLMALLLTGTAALLQGSSTQAKPPAKEDDQSLSAFMRKKLDASSKILEGITTEDKQLVIEGADTLLTMSKAEIWNVIADEDYREFNHEFRASVRKLRAAAEKENVDSQTLQWMDSMKSCVECHKYVRAQRTAVKK